MNCKFFLKILFLTVIFFIYSQLQSFSMVFPTLHQFKNNSNLSSHMLTHQPLHNGTDKNKLNISVKTILSITNQTIESTNLLIKKINDLYAEHPGHKFRKINAVTINKIHKDLNSNPLILKYIDTNQDFLPLYQDTTILYLLTTLQWDICVCNWSAVISNISGKIIYSWYSRSCPLRLLFNIIYNLNLLIYHLESICLKNNSDKITKLKYQNIAMLNTLSQSISSLNIDINIPTECSCFF